MVVIEARPCICNKVTTGVYYKNSDCLDCWSYYFDPYWSKRWGKPKDKKPPVKLLEELDPEFEKKFFEKIKKDGNFNEENLQQKLPNIPKSKSLACVNLGTIVSRANCNCPFKFVHKCDKHEFCVRGEQQTPDVRSCLDCPDYEPDDPTA